MCILSLQDKVMTYMNTMILYVHIIQCKHKSLTLPLSDGAIANEPYYYHGHDD